MNKPPTILYKYTTAETAEIILNNSKLRWSSPALFNDIAEFQRIPVFDPPIEKAQPIVIKRIIDIGFGEIESDIDKLHPNVKLIISVISILKNNEISKENILEKLLIQEPYNQEYVTNILREFFEKEEFIRKARVISLTEDPKNEVMWAHYSNNHRGCVLGFRHITELDTPFSVAKPVNYSEGPPVIYDGVDFLLYGNSKDLQRKIHEGICYCKDIKWSYEKEWRVVTWREDAENQDFSDILFFKEELESVTFGLKFDNYLTSNITSVWKEKYPFCDLYKMESKHGILNRVKIG